MNNEQLLRNVIREMVEQELQELEEMTTTGDVAGYNVPMAFQGNNPKNKARKKGIATQLGYTLTNRGEKELDRGADSLQEAKMRYHEYKKDESASPTKKIARAISEVNRNLQEMERVLNMNSRLQKESGLASEALYRRTQQGLLKLEARLLHLAGKVRDIRGK